MTLHLKCSAKYLKFGDRTFDKITEEYNPPSYWFRLKVSAKGRKHNQCFGHITNIWHGNHRRVKGFDPLVLYWLNEPLQSEAQANITPEYFKPDIPSGNYELAGLMHVKLPMRPQNPNVPLPAENIPDELLPEVRLNVSSKEPKHTSKRTDLPYGIYYAEISVADNEGNKVKKTFKVWGFREVEKCRIRTSRFYERFLLVLKSFLSAV